MEWSGPTSVSNPDQTGDTYCENEGEQFMFRAQMTAYPDQASVSIPGSGIEILDTIAIPTDEQFTSDTWFANISVPDGYDYLILVYDTDELYTADQVYTGFGYGHDFIGPADVITQDYVEAECIGIPDGG